VQGNRFAPLSTSRPELCAEDKIEEAFPQVWEDAPLSLVSILLQTHQAVLVAKKGYIEGIITTADFLRSYNC